MAEGEWYHCYNRGVDRRRVFSSKRDSERFLILMLLSNSTRAIRSSNAHRYTSLASLCADEKIDMGSPLVDIGAYCLMPNHVHFVMKEIRAGGIALFMQRLFTGYTMYFNTQHNRTGALFAGTYKSKHLFSDRYFKHAIHYVHMNPIELEDSEWKSGRGDLGKAEAALRSYGYSSLPDHLGIQRPERRLLGSEAFSLLSPHPSLSSVLFDAQAYHREFGPLYSQKRP